MSLLTICQDAARRIGLTPPDTVISSVESNAIALLGFAQEEGKELARRATWQKITKEATFSTTASDLDYALESDFDWYLPDTMFNRTSNRQVAGPISAAEWQRIQASLVTLVNPGFRFRGGLILISPTPSATETVAYEYMSNQWCESVGGTDQSAWAADTDLPLLNEELHTLGIVWRFKQAKGYDYSEAFRAYETQVTLAMLRDGAKPRLDSSRGSRDRVPLPPQTPETYTFA